MGKVYWNKREIPIPEGLHINKNDARVFSLSHNPDGSMKRIVFGYATSERTMHVNETFKLFYPDLWKAYYGEDDLHPFMLHAGIYALCLGASKRNSLYHHVQDSFGPMHGNAIMDYAMFSILTRLDVTQLFPDRMAEEVLFSEKAYSDSWYSSLFHTGMTRQQIHGFKKAWMKECISRGYGKAWVAIDGTNNHCEVTDSDLSDQGKSKTGKNVDLVSYIYAVNSETGMPVTYCVNDGSVVDSKAFQLICVLLEDSGIEIEGVIIDRGFCTNDVVELTRKCGYKYILMLKSNTAGHAAMMEEYAEKIRWKVPYCVDDKGLFGVTKKQKLFSNGKEEAYVNLYYDGANGSERSITLIRKIRETARELQKKLGQGKKVSVSSEMRKYLSVDEKAGKVIYDYDQWQASMDGKGYHSIASSEDLGAERVNQIYHLRDACEKQFMIMKSMAGFDVTRVHSDPSIESKFAVCFIASIIRNEIMNACKEFGYDTNRMLREIDRIQLLLKNDGRYYPIRNYTTRQKDVLGVFGIDADSFESIAFDVSYRNANTVKSQEREIPTLPEEEKKKRGRPPKQKVEVPRQEKKRGRPKGSLNKKTLERLEREKNEPPKEKCGRGRPKGSLNKKTLERLKQESLQPSTEKRRRGRPKGSLNKKTIEKMKKQLRQK